MYLAIKSRNASETFTSMSGRNEKETAYVAALIDEQLGLEAPGKLSHFAPLGICFAKMFERIY